MLGVSLVVVRRSKDVVGSDESDSLGGVFGTAKMGASEPRFRDLET